MFSRVVLLGIILLTSMSLLGQVYQHNFGTTTISTHPYTVAPGTLDANLSNSSWSNSTGAWTSFAGSSGQAISLSNSGGTPTITLTFNITGGCSLDITSFNFWRQRSSTGAQNWSMTINGTNVGSGTIPTAGATVGNTAVSGITGLTGTVTIVISLSGATGTGTFRLDDFTLFGSTSCGGSSHTVTFNGNGNDGGSMSNQTASGSTALTTNAFTKTGCSFTVWNTASDGSGTSYTNGATYDFSADITLYAQWNCSPPTGGNCMDEDFVDFSDWTNYGTATDNDASHYGANGPCRALGTGDNLESPSVDNPTQLQFYQDASSGGSGSTATVKYSLDGGTTWVACYSFTVSSSGATETVDLTNVGGVDLSAETGVIFQFSSSFNTWYLDDVSVTCGTPAPNTITTGSITGSPFSIQCATNDNGSVAFISTDVYGAGNIYTAQLSDASGSFSFPVNIGTLTSTANSGTINITIPAGTPSGSNYKIRVISSNPYIVGSASSAFTITLTDGPCAPPHITSVLFNGCDPAGCGGEGRSEMVFANTGVNSVLVNSSNLDLIYPGSPPYDLLGSIVSNASTITTMNDSAACGTLFYDANGQTVPPNTTLLLVSSDICAEINFDWSSLCGSGPIYVVFGQSGTLGDTWHDSGNFGNSSGTKTFDLDITATDAITYGYTYSYVSGNQGDGEYATFSSSPPGGNALNTGVLPDCKITVAVLPIELLSFTGKSIGSSNLLEWKTTTEINNDYFTLERSSNATHFSELGIIEGAGNSNTLLHYQFTDNAPLEGVNYYRLKQTDFDGVYSYSSIVALSNKTTAFSIWNSAETLFIKGDNENSTSSLKIYNLLGELVLEKYFQENITINTTDFSSGIYLVKIQSNENLITQKVKF